MAHIRCFIAVEIPDEVKERLWSVKGELEEIAPEVRWVRKEGMHLTLKFLGNVEESRLGEIEEAIAEAVSGLGEIEAEVASTGAFPKADFARVVWAGVIGEVKKIRELQRRIENAMSSLGFEREGRSFVPHITLGRIKRPGRNRKMAAKLAAMSEYSFGSFTIREVVLFKSQLHPEGAIYTALARIPLKG